MDKYVKLIDICEANDCYNEKHDCDTCVFNKIPAADVQLVDAKEILRHLDAMMICIGNAYDTSHGLLRSDMEFIEKQEKIIKELLSNKLETRNADNNYSQFIKDISEEPIAEMRKIKEGWGNE